MKKHPKLEERRKNIPQSVKDEVDREFEKLAAEKEEKTDFEKMAKMTNEYIRLSKYATMDSNPEIWADGYVKGSAKVWNDLQQEITTLRARIAELETAKSGQKQG